jgi:hypothetical protein
MTGYLDWSNDQYNIILKFRVKRIGSFYVLILGVGAASCRDAGRGLRTAPKTAAYGDAALQKNRGWKPLLRPKQTNLSNTMEFWCTIIAE